MLTRNREIFRSYRTYRGAECAANTDHRLVAATLCIQLTQTCRKSHTPPKFDTDRLCTDDVKAQYTLELSNQFAILDTLPDDTQDTWVTVRTAITTAATKVLGRKPKLRKPWLSFWLDC